MRWDASDAQALARAAEALAAGRLVAFPTETVYGLGARADDDAAVAGLYAAKGRPAGHPLIVHVADAAAAAHFAARLPGPAERLIRRFWPGPLTVIVPRADGIAAAAAGALPTIGLRSPAHPVARALIEAAAALGVPGVAAPSANRFGRVSPTRAEHVEAEFGEAVPVLDGGDCEFGIESAIVDCSRARPALLRPGVLARAELEAAAGERFAEPDAGAARAPGTLAAHYAPNAKLRLMPARALADALGVFGAGNKGATALAVYSRTVRPASRAVVHRRMPDDPRAAAHELFAALRELDGSGAALIWVEQPPAGPEWDGVRDRLQRAAAA